MYNDIAWFVCCSCMVPVLLQVGNKSLTAWMFWSERHVEAKIYSQTDTFLDPRLQRSKHSSNYARSSEQQDILGLGYFSIPETSIAHRGRKSCP